MGGSATYFDFKKLLTTPMKKAPFITDLAEACNQVIGKEVEERRRRLERSRDSVKNRKGQIVSWVDYLPEDDKLAYDIDTNESISNIVIGEAIPKAKVLRCISNIGVYGAQSAVDYLEVEFTTKDNKTARWLMPIQAPQERSLLLSNSYMLGFDFYNTTLSDEDYQRLYEFLNMFWPENGIDDKFIRFIGFIKNLKLELAPLWAQDNGTDIIEFLEELNETRVKTTDGGDWYLTSHVSINYDLKQQNNQYPIDFDEIERLFYLFAPIMLVLERIVGHLDVLIEMGGAVASIADVVNYGISERDPNVNITHYRIAVAKNQIVNYGYFADTDYKSDPDDDLSNTFKVVNMNVYTNPEYLSFSLNIQNDAQNFDVNKYDYNLIILANNNTIYFKATLDNGLLYTDKGRLVCYVPTTDFYLPSYNDVLYTLKYKDKFANSFTDILQGSVLKVDFDTPQELNIYIADHTVNFSLFLTDANNNPLNINIYDFYIEFYSNNILVLKADFNNYLYSEETNNYLLCQVPNNIFNVDFTKSNTFIAHKKLKTELLYKSAFNGQLLEYTLGGVDTDKTKSSLTTYITTGII